MDNNVICSICIVLVILILLLVDKYYQEQGIIEKMENNYIKFEDTIIPGSMIDNVNKGTLDQAKEQCNNNSKCIGIIRKNKEADIEDDYYVIEKIDYCINKYNKLPSKENNNKENNNKENNNKENNNDKIDMEKFIYGNNFIDYSTYLKEETDDSMRCVRLNIPISLKSFKFPFDRLIADNEFFIRSKTMDDISNSKSDNKIYARNGVFTIVKGLTGEGISFEVELNNDKYYLINEDDSDDITVGLLKDDSNFKRNATFHLDLKFTLQKGIENDKYISIKKVDNNRNYYWKVNSNSKKIILTYGEDIKDDNDSLNDVLFEIIKPLEYIEVSEEIEAPAPSLDNQEDNTANEQEEKKDILEKLELDIRELQHDQNLKLMDIMVNVNKFKLMDLSLSDYLTKCTQTSSE